MLGGIALVTFPDILRPRNV